MADMSWEEVCILMVGRTIVSVTPGNPAPTIITFDTGDQFRIDWAGGWEWYGFEWIPSPTKAL